MVEIMLIYFLSLFEVKYDFLRLKVKHFHTHYEKCSIHLQKFDVMWGLSFLLYIFFVHVETFDDRDKIDGFYYHSQSSNMTYKIKSERYSHPMYAIW